jgi:hypothetical protein
MDNEVIVELMGEGGSRALYGVRADDRWLFSTDLITQVDPPSTSSRAQVVDTWSAAVEQLDSHSGWHALTPRNAHPDFRAALLQLVTERAALDPAAIDLARWEEACTLDDSAARPAIVSAPVHSSDAWLYDEFALEPSDAELELLRSHYRSRGVDEATIDRMAPKRRD